MMIDRATAFAYQNLKIPPQHCRDLASDAVTFAWEECKFGRATAEDDGTFWALVTERLYEIRNAWRQQDLSLSAPQTNAFEKSSDLYDAGWISYQPPEQFHVCYLNEVCSGIELLPQKHASVMRYISRGWNALDVAKELRVPVHTIFRLIAEARRYLFGRELVAMAKDYRKNEQVAAE